MKRKVIYVAGPISKGDLVDNCRRAHDAGIALLKAGASPIVPHGSCYWGNKLARESVSHWHVDVGFVPESLPSGTTHEDWYEADLEFVRRSDAVLRLTGESVGADLEVKEANKRGLPVFYTIDVVLAWLKEG